MASSDSEIADSANALENDQDKNTPNKKCKNKAKKAKSSPIICGTCNVEIDQDDKAVICEICSISYHAKCQNISNRQHSVIANANMNLHWFCHHCDRGTSKVLVQLSSIVKEQEGMKEDLTALQGTNKLIYDELKDIKSNLVERNKKDEENDNKLSMLSSQVSHIEVKLKEGGHSYPDDMSKRPSPALQRAHTDMLAWEHDKHEQYGRRNNMRIYGVPETQGEDTCQIVMDIANHIGSPLTVHDICTSHRLGYHRHPREGEGAAPPRPIIVRFTRRDAKFRMMKQRKRLGAVNDPQSHYSNDYSSIFLNDDLTSLRSKMRYILSREEGIERVNSINGKLLCTKLVNGKNVVTSIDTPADLMRKMNWQYQRLEDEGLVASVDQELLGYYQEYYGECYE